jgi:hypothetical protein
MNWMEIGQVGQERQGDLETILITDTSEDSGENSLGQLCASYLTRISAQILNMALLLVSMPSKEQHCTNMTWEYLLGLPRSLLGK